MILSDRSGRFSLARPAAGLAILLCIGCLTASIGHADALSGDRAWAMRSERIEGDRADPVRIDEAIGHYRDAVAEEPTDRGAHWKLLRALHYSIDFTTLSEAAQDERVREAVERVRASEDLREADSTEPEARADQARLLFWSSIIWGTHAQRVGLITIVREGIAKSMYEDAQESMNIDPSVDDGGALRLLSRLHATLPRVPFVSGWVDRDQALPLAEQAYALDPSHPGNQLILALTLLEQGEERDERALALLQGVASSEPRSDFVAEDLRIREQARARLAELEASSR